MRKFLLASLVLFSTLIFGACPGDKDGDSKGSLNPGETSFDFTLSGGNLTETVRIQGVSSKPLVAGYSTISILAGNLEGVASADDAYRVQNVTMSTPNEATTFEAARGDYDIVISGFRNAEGEPRDYSLRPIVGESTITVHESTDALYHVSFEGKASPTQLGAKDLVFEFSGTIVHRHD